MSNQTEHSEQTDPSTPPEAEAVSTPDSEPTPTPPPEADDQLPGETVLESSQSELNLDGNINRVLSR
ncbi:MAG: hypothetical protein J07HX5_00966 [halophilic archaeon J07HX5]|jgi:hypothetical protein|nr:MAG: hypothetical protein J07HX5_00966 [halophilic archaeon J07HX5]